MKVTPLPSPASEYWFFILFPKSDHFWPFPHYHLWLLRESPHWFPSPPTPQPPIPTFFPCRLFSAQHLKDPVRSWSQITPVSAHRPRAVSLPLGVRAEVPAVAWWPQILPCSLSELISCCSSLCSPCSSRSGLCVLLPRVFWPQGIYTCCSLAWNAQAHSPRYPCGSLPLLVQITAQLTPSQRLSWLST